MSKQHRKRVTLSATAPDALVETRTALVLNRKFVAMVRKVYRNGNLQSKPLNQVVALVHVALLPLRGQLVGWNNAAIEQALIWLNDRGQIVLPDSEPALAGAR